ncbi:ABC transporter permease [Zavarzinia compransoris]|uniref:Glycosyl transferase family 1 n=1 Tax=Zavarzinia compransoris TaxID=1264899 RepID=A0A317DWU3_9PROT|nr:FtsX-like permease family protein [Zavarzinia compransoris]PWR18824.1 glycosyl transferase family 1 [Zavarzinia compransoris]TDP48811.1 putative ABC transport system permease protein [Zavarzinia compransoris]
MSRLAVTLARRELRAGVRGFRIFLACLILGVAAIAGIGNLGRAVEAGLAAKGQDLLGGDIELRLVQREATAGEEAYIAGKAVAVSTVRQMRAMARRVGGAEGRTLVELKAVDGAYPLYGSLGLEPAQSPTDAFARRDGLPGAAVDAVLLTRIEAAVGDTITLGDAQFRVSAVIAAEPDIGSDAFGLGPRVMIAMADLPATGLLQLGSQISTSYRLKLPPGTDARALAEDLKADQPDAGWRIRNSSNAAPGIRQFVDRLGQFLTLVGLTALVVGGVGVGSAVRAHMATKTRTIAILKSLGAPAGLVFAVFLIQVTAIALVGIAIGLAVGALLPVALGGVIGAALPIPAEIGIYAEPLLLASAFGLVIALLFALWPLARAREVPAAHLFRDLVAPDRVLPRKRYLAMMAALVVILIGLALATANEISFGLYFILGTLGVFVLLRLAGLAVTAIAARLPRPARPGARLALGNLHRPGAATGSVVLSLGLGLTLLVAVALVQFNLQNQVTERLPSAAPSFFFVDIQTDQIEAFTTLVTGIEGTADLKAVPSMRGRITRIKGVPADQYPVKPDGRWALRGDRGVTYAAVPPEGASLSAGAWWPADYRGAPLVSFDAALAEAMDLSIGDRITVNLLGRDIEAEIASLRRIDYTTLTINFALVFSPGMLEAAPHNFLATVRASPEAEPKVFRAVTDRFPNISVIRMKEALETVDGMLRQLALAVQVTASVTLVAGLFVLAGALAAGHRQRLYDAVILKTLGASRAQVLAAFSLEYAVLGLATGLVALGAGTAAAYGVMVGVMRSSFTFDPLIAVLAAAAGIVLTVGLGLAGTWGALAGRPAPVLRSLA